MLFRYPPFCWPRGKVGKFGGAQFRYDATVGGQIPIITLLPGTLSGTGQDGRIGSQDDLI